MKFCVSLLNTYWYVLLDQWKLWSAGGARGKVGITSFSRTQTDIHQIKPTFNIGLIFLLRFQAVDHCSSVPPQAFFLQYFTVSLEADSEQDFLLRFNTLQQLSLSWQQASLLNQEKSQMGLHLTGMYNDESLTWSPNIHEDKYTSLLCMCYTLSTEPPRFPSKVRRKLCSNLICNSLALLSLEISPSLSRMGWQGPDYDACAVGGFEPLCE